MNRLSSIEDFGHVLFGTAHAWRNKLDQRLRPLGFTQGKWRTLLHLSKSGNKLTQKEIAQRMGIEEPTLAGLLNRLEHDGWIERRGSVNDRRCKVVHLQRRSKNVTEQIFNAAHTLRHELIKDVPRSDLETCLRVLEKIRARAEARDRAGNSHESQVESSGLS